MQYWDEGCAEPELTCASINAMCVHTRVASCSFAPAVGPMHVSRVCACSGTPRASQAYVLSDVSAAFRPCRSLISAWVRFSTSRHGLTCGLVVRCRCAINNLAKHPSVRHRIRETEPGFLCGLSR